MFSIRITRCCLDVTDREGKGGKINTMIDEMNFVPVPLWQETPQVVKVVACTGQHEPCPPNPATHHFFGGHVKVLGMCAEAVRNIAHHTHQAGDGGRCAGKVCMQVLDTLLTTRNGHETGTHKLLPDAKRATRAHGPPKSESHRVKITH